MSKATHKLVLILLAGIAAISIAGPPAACAQSAHSSEADAFDVLFLAADAPLWIRLRLEGDSESVHAVRLRYARMMIRSVAPDKDGFADPDEAARLPATGRPGATAEPLGDQWKTFDTDPADDRLSPEEYLAAVREHLGPALLTRRKPPRLYQSVQLLSRLDRDGDGRLSADEIRQGAQILAAFDFDDDGTFSPAELQPFPQTMVDAAMAQQRGIEAQPFVIVDETTDRPELLSAIFNKYAGESGISLRRSGLSEFAFAEADSNGNGSLDEAEAEALLRPRPLAEIGINLQAGRVTLGRRKRGSERIEEIPVEASRRLALRLGTEATEFSARDNRFAAADQVNLAKINFLRGDADKNGYMGPQEFVSLGLTGSLEDVDADGDGKVFMEELDRFIRIDASLAQCAVEMEVEAIEKPLFEILDANSDRRLTTREFADGIDRMQEFDQDGDRLLDAGELDLLRRFRVKFSFVTPPALIEPRSMRDQQRMPLVNRTGPTGPPWFQSMDRNQDREVTWREFLGPREAFDRLDADGNGWIDPAEADAAQESSD